MPAILSMNPGGDLTTLGDRARERTLDLLERAALHFGKPMPRVEIRFDLGGRAAGQARFRNGRPPLIRYNSDLLARNGERFLAQTVPHEAAHVVVFALHPWGTRPHGPEWRAVMALFGAEARRCHEYDTDHLPGRRLRRFEYRCGCRRHLLTSIRHNRALRGQRYLCRRCGQTLIPVDRP